VSVREVTDGTFPEEVLASDRPVLVDFWAPWCAPCRLVSPIVEQIGDESAGRLRTAKVDIDQNAATASRYAVFSIPTLVLFKDGREAERFVGLRPKDELATRIARHL
jgi:thioredoxin 1